MFQFGASTAQNNQFSFHGFCLYANLEDTQMSERQRLGCVILRLCCLSLRSEFTQPRTWENLGNFWPSWSQRRLEIAGFCKMDRTSLDPWSCLVAIPVLIRARRNRNSHTAMTREQNVRSILQSPANSNRRCDHLASDLARFCFISIWNSFSAAAATVPTPRRLPLRCWHQGRLLL